MRTCPTLSELPGWESRSSKVLLNPDLTYTLQCTLTLFPLSRQTSPLHLFFPSTSSSSISYTTLHSQGFCYVHLPVWVTVCIVAVNGVSLRSQDTVTVGFRSRFPHWGCALCVHREGRSLSDGLPPKLSSTGSSPLLVMCGATGSSCGKSCPTERGLTGTWLIKMYVFNSV